MTLAVCWLVFPAVLALVSLGCGLLLPVRGPLVLPAGFALVVVLTQLTTVTEATAQLTVSLVVSAAAGGLVLRVRWRPDVGALVAGVTTFGVFAAPVVASGTATFAGYIKLDDTATFLGLLDRVMVHGRSLSGLPPSSYEAALSVNLAHGYPLGSLLPLGVGRALVGVDTAWLFQPYLAFLAALLALSLLDIARSVLHSGWTATVAAVVAAQAALLYGYALWGGVKELAAAALLALVAALAARKATLPLAVAAAALLGTLSLAGAIWLAVPALLLWRRAPVVLAATAVLSVPTLLAATAFLRSSNRSPLTDTGELGNLLRPLRPLQAFGIWPTGDFRSAPVDARAAYVLVAVCGAAAMVGLAMAARRRAWSLLAYSGAALLGAGILEAVASPWVAAKGLAIASPSVVLAALVGCGVVLASRRWVEAGLAGAAVVGGVLWSNVLAYHDVSLAPRAQLVELERIGTRFAGQGPALMTEYQPYGVRHFLRALDPEGASELRRRLVPLADGSMLAKGAYADLDRFSLDAVLAYRTLVLRTSPTESRPPAPYRLVWRGRWYEVWEAASVPVAGPVASLPLDGPYEPAAVPGCADVVRLGRDGRLLAAAPRAQNVIAPLGRLRARGNGTLDVEVTLDRAGRYGLWLGGSYGGSLEVAVDGIPVSALPAQLNVVGQYTPLGSVRLAAGEHRLRLRLVASALRPGTGGQTDPLGPLVLSPATAQQRLLTVPSGQARRLCGRRLDWVEALAG